MLFGDQINYFKFKKVKILGKIGPNFSQLMIAFTLLYINQRTICW